MATGEELSLLKELAEKYPAVLGALIGAPVGGAVGGFSSDPGEEGRGALGGAALGAGLGAVGGGMSSAVRKATNELTPGPLTAVGLGAAGGGLLAGRYAKSSIAPWIKERLLEQKESKKEASDMSQQVAEQAKEALEKQAELEKVAADRVNAFDFGMEYFLAEKGIEKAAFAKQLGLEDPELLAPAMIQWLNKQLEEKK
jgi:hypothetical protein